MIDWVRATLNRTSDKTQRGITLISNWLQNVVWLVETKFLALSQKAYAQNSIVYACIRLLSQSIPEPPLVAYRVKSNRGVNGKQKELEELPEDDDLAKLIRRPNELMTEYEFWELTSIHMAIVGRSVWLKERSNGGIPIALWPLRPDRVGPIYSTSLNQGERVLWGYSYQIPGSGEFVRIPRSEVLAFNFPDPAGESGGIVEGLGPVTVLAREISADNESTSFVGALLANYAAPTVALKVKAAVRSEAEANFIKSKFRQEFGGARRGTPALLDAETDVQLLGFNLRELEFPDIRANAESRICAALGVPPILVGLKVGLDRSTFSNMAEARTFFSEVTLINYWRRFQEQYTNDVAIEFGEDIVTEFNLLKVRALSAREMERLGPIQQAFNDGVATRNDYRRELKLDPLPAEIGDVIVIKGEVKEIPTTEEAKKILAEQQAEQPALLPGKPQPALLPGKPQPVASEAQAAVDEAEKLLGLVRVKSSEIPPKPLTVDRPLWIGLKIPDDIAEKLVIPEHPSTGELHLTLVYLDDIPNEIVPHMPEIIGRFAESTPPIEIEISGVGRFSNAFYARVEPTTGLISWRDRLVGYLASEGITVTSDFESWTPHITLLNLGPDEASPDHRVPTLTVNLDVINVNTDGDGHLFYLEGSDIKSFYRVVVGELGKQFIEDESIYVSTNFDAVKAIADDIEGQIVEIKLDRSINLRWVDGEVAILPPGVQFAEVDLAVKQHRGAHAGHRGAHAGSSSGKIKAEGQAAELLNSLPPGAQTAAYAAGLKEVKVLGKREYNKEVGTTGVRPGWDSVAVMRDDGTMLLRADNPNLTKSFHHEFAHALDPLGDRASGSKYKVSEDEAWMRASGWKVSKGGTYTMRSTIVNRPTSEYGKSSPWEDFAESFATYTAGSKFDRRVMQGESEKRYEYMQKFASSLGFE